jgi:hypothetical protein
MLKKVLKIILFVEFFKKILGLKFYDYIKHTLRYYSFFPLNYSIDDEINFGSTKANDFFKYELNKSKIYLEYGSGASTLLAHKLNKNSLTVEGDNNFYKYMKKKIKSNKILLKSLGIVNDFSIPINSKLDYDLKKISNKQKIRVKNYCNGVLEDLDKKKIIPDLILVDGRYRNLTGIYIYNFFKNKNVKFKIIFDDYIHRKHHHILEKFFEIETFERFGIATKLKKNLNTDDFIQENYYDCR